MPLVCFLVTGLSPGMPGGGAYFCDITNYKSEPLAILAIHGYKIKYTYVYFENVEEKKLYLLVV